MRLCFKIPTLTAANEAAAHDSQTSPIFSNEFKAEGDDTMVQLSPYGRFPNVQGLQVFNAADAKAIASDFVSNAKMAVGLGLPWYIGHPDHPLHKDRYKDTAAYGRIKGLEAKADSACQACGAFAANSADCEPCREHGLFAKVRFNEKGKKAIANEEFHGHSVNWRLRKVGGEWHPFSLKSVGFTNEPNIPVPAIHSANEEAEISQRFVRLAAIRLFANEGTSEGALKGWETRRGEGSSSAQDADAGSAAADKADTSEAHQAALKKQAVAADKNRQIAKEAKVRGDTTAQRTHEALAADADRKRQQHFDKAQAKAGGFHLDPEKIKAAEKSHEDVKRIFKMAGMRKQ